MKHAMIDLETLGTATGSVILSIGAVAFDEQGVVGGSTQFHMAPDAAEQVKLGLTIDPSTIMWWLDQAKDAQQSIRSGVLSSLGKGNVKAVLHALRAWYAVEKCETVWSNGADFDIPLLNALHRAAGVSPPWAYNASRCCRTIMANCDRKMGGFGTKNALAHDALADAIYQATEVAAAMRWLKRCEQAKREQDSVMAHGAADQ